MTRTLITNMDFLFISFSFAERQGSGATRHLVEGTLEPIVQCSFCLWYFGRGFDYLRKACSLLSAIGGAAIPSTYPRGPRCVLDVYF